MAGLLADTNVEGHVHMLIRLLHAEPWKGVWEEMDVRIQTFEDLGLCRSASDAQLWQGCQDHDLVLVTGNRNLDGDDSLEATIRRKSTPDSLPVFTLANPERILKNREYAQHVAERFLEYLFEIEEYRGVGRIFIP